jgi:hypothetical protein
LSFLQLGHVGSGRIDRGIWGLVVDSCFEILLLDLGLIYDSLLQFLSSVFMLRMLRSGIRGHTYPRLMLT